MPAAQTDPENCVAHNGSLIPVPGRDIMVAGVYQGGVSVFDFTDPAHPIEIAFFDRGPIDAKHLMLGGVWSAYWYNGYIYGAEIARGLDIFKLTPSEFLTQNEIDAASPGEVDGVQPAAPDPKSPGRRRGGRSRVRRSAGTVEGITPERAAAMRRRADGRTRSSPAATKRRPRQRS